MISGGTRIRLLLTLPLAVGALAVGATPASAANLFVNSNGDVADQTLDGTCLTVGGLCTLRAAIQEANNETNNPGADTITLSGVVFTGSGAPSVIDIGATPLPAITAPVSIACQTEPATTPCAQVDSPPPGNNVLTVNADNVTIRGLSITNGLQGIGVFEDALADQLTGFQLKHSWIGITLAGTAGSHNTGVFLDPSVSAALIGGTTAADRNVFGFNNVDGVRVIGADGTDIQGNYFGVLADGATQAANAFDIRVGGANLDPTDDSAIGTTIGGALDGPQEISSECDGPCNVISGATADAISLDPLAAGAIPAGETTIYGNYIGVNHDATAAVASINAGVDVGGAASVSIGNNDSSGANLMTGGAVAVSASTGAELQVAANRIGVTFDQTQALTPPQVGVDIVNPNQASVNANRIATSVGDAVVVEGGSNVELDENEIGVGPGNEDLGVGGSGVRLISTTTPSMEVNTIAGAGVDGILLDNTTGADIFDNTIGIPGLGNSGAGVRISNGSTDNIVGSDNPSFPNEFSDNGGDAVAIVGATTDGNDVLRNTGTGNSLFIDLGDDGLGATTDANNDIQPPGIAAVTATSTSGTATPDATVRLFDKDLAANGEIAGFLGSDVADGSGNWEVTYGSTPAFVGATQTSDADGTSEMAVAAGGAGPGADETPPETTITKGPKKKTTKTKAKFKFESSEAGSTFECKFDKKPFKSCTSPFKKKKLKPKKHKFKVRAIDAAGNVDPTPAKKKFKVLAE